MNLAAKHQNNIGRFDYDLMIQHFMDGKVAIKRMEVPAGATALSHKHKYDHFSILAEGRAIVTTDGAEPIEYKPGAVIKIRAGIHHEIHAIDDIMWFCIQATHETDPDKFDKVMIGHV